MEGPQLTRFRVFLTVREGLTESSIRHCLSRIKIFLKWLGDDKLTTDVIDKFLFSLKASGLKNNSINTYVFALRMYEKFLRHANVLTGSWELCSLPKNKPSIEILTPREILKILATRIEYGLFRHKPCDRLNDTYTTLTRLLSTTGCRISEALGLKPKDVSDTAVLFEDTKNHDWRKVPIFPPLPTELQREIGRGGEYVFITMTGAQMSTQRYTEDLHKRAKLAGITKRVHPHIFRHSFITQLLTEGVDALVIASISGHRDVQVMYDRYTHLADRKIYEAASKHPIVRGNLPIDYIIDDTWKTLNSLGKDDRLDVSISRSGHHLAFQLSPRNRA